MHGFNERHYIPLPKHNCQSLSRKYSLKVIHPYDKYTSSTDSYYIAFNANKVPTSDISIEITYDNKKPATPIKENRITLLDARTFRLRTFKQNEIEKTLLYYSFVSCANQQIDYTILFNKEKLFEANNIVSRSSKAIKIPFL